MAAGLPPDPPIDSTVSPGQSGHISDHEVIAGTLAMLREAAGMTVAEIGTDLAAAGAVADALALKADSADLGTAAAMTPTEVVEDAGAQASLSGTFAPQVALRLPGAGTDFWSAADAAAWNPTATLDVRVTIAADDWTPATAQHIVSHHDTNGNQRAWSFGLHSTGGQLVFVTSADGSFAPSALSSVGPTVVDGGWLSLRAVWAAATPSVTFYTRAAGTPLNDDTGWTQLGAVATTGTAAAVFDSSSLLRIGAIGTAGLPFDGLVSEVLVRVDDVDRAHVDFSVPTHPRLTDYQGVLWSPNGSAWSWEVLDAPLG